ncbi:hypothetical protein ABID22_000889 [Pontibacter aydingkolensis]|uniref:Uncharacterized protein n=1 Tax=Pontibacter aydingkolensis TaxID=1911536 RepID=A0ABS7CSN7_9BACT|nr:hypothetical protein [Pontibacter aydingkolensis]MBW7466859.1 hypothetical protein [Pontibacter aydingkolensis]
MEKADQLSPSDIKSFRTTIATTTLKPGTVLWRFASSMHASKFGAYWVDAKTMSEIMITFSALNIYDLNFKKSVIRDSLALLSNWDTHCEYRVKIELKKEVVAHVGTIGTQQTYMKANLNNKRTADAAVKKLAGGNSQNIEKMIEQRIGGYTQYVIPRFRDRSLNQNDNQYAKLLHFCHI